MKKMLCPRHEEKTPSCVVYETSAYCFGCGSVIPLRELGLTEGNTEEVIPENINKSLEYIASLPTKIIRGLELPYDDHNYYLVWPNKDYYKARRFNPGAKPKYYTPKGVRKPPYALFGNQGVMIIVEGELNALSIKQALPKYTVMSPGSTSDLGSSSFLGKVGVECGGKLLLIADADNAGKTALLQAQLKLRTYNYDTYGIAMKEDANDVLVKYGKEKLYEEIRPALERLSQTK